MTFLDSLRRSRSDPPAVWLQFTIAFRPDTHDIYLFFEGNNDFSFYMPEIRRCYSNGNLVPFKCRGKATVLGIIPNVSSRLDYPWRALFFIDKDLDDLLGISLPTHNYLLQTEYYSVENYLVTEAMLKIVWCDIFHLPIQDVRLPRVIAQFHQSTTDFVGAIRSVMSVILFYRKNGLRPLLSNVKLEKIIQFDTDFRLTLLNDWFDHFKLATDVPTDPDWAIVSTISRSLEQLNPKLYIRGKFEIWFFVSFMQRIAAVVSEKIGDQARAKIHTQINIENAVEVLSGRDSPPAHLRSFLIRCLSSS